MNRTPGGLDLAAAIGQKHDVLGQQRHQPVEITLATRREEACRKFATFAFIRIEAVTPLADTATSTADELPAGRLRSSEHSGDLVIVVVEDVVQQKRRALNRRELLEQDEERQRQGIGELHGHARVGLVNEQRLRQPRSDVGLPSRPG